MQQDLGKLLYTTEGLKLIDVQFCQYLLDHNEHLWQRLVKVRSLPINPESDIASQLYIDLASHIDNFIASLFDIKPEVYQLRQQAIDFKQLYDFKRHYIQRTIFHKYKGDIPDIKYKVDSYYINIISIISIMMRGITLIK